MTDTIHPAFAAAERLAPEPASRDTATVEAWTRHYAALALAAHSAFDAALRTVPRDPEPGSRPDIGYLIAIAVASTATAVALTATPDEVAHALWDFTPEAGALNGEYVDWLAETLDGLGVNPADLYPAFNGADFRSPRADEVAR
jgi:hypothetical protein